MLCCDSARGRHSRRLACSRSHVLRAYCNFESKQANSTTLFGRRPNNKAEIIKKVMVGRTIHCTTSLPRSDVTNENEVVQGIMAYPLNTERRLEASTLNGFGLRTRKVVLSPLSFECAFIMIIQFENCFNRKLKRLKVLTNQWP